MPNNDGNIKFLYGSLEDYKKYTTNSEHLLDDNFIYFITDKHLILVGNKSYATRPETMIYLDHYSDFSQVPKVSTIDTEIDDYYTPTYACTVGNDNILYVATINKETKKYNDWLELSKLNPNDVFAKLGNYIVATIDNSTDENDSKIPSVKAIKDLVTSMKNDETSGIVTLVNGEISWNQLPFSIDDKLDINSANPVQNKVIKDALDGENGKVDKVHGKQLSTNDFTDKYEIKLQNLNASGIITQADWIETSSESPSYIQNKPKILVIVPDVDSQEYLNLGNLVSAKAVRDAINDSEIVIDSVMNADSANPVENRVITNELTNIESTLDSKVDKVPGQGLSDNNFTDELKSKLENIGADKFTEVYREKLDSIEYGAQVNVQADWDAGTDTFTGDGATTEFTLSKSPETVDYVYVNNTLVSSDKYSYKIVESEDGNKGVITLTDAPAEGVAIAVEYNDPAKILHKPNIPTISDFTKYISTDDGIIGSA